ncbi:MAG: hydroxymyristoyl-ACP dehydratase [Alistipes sp.]|nr:hydroxymyristoyl-ACP dehydratase [Alistipes sp.]MDO5497079.1 hydroxymyristoyl-ACP dehydratase [Alistipes sp.]
MSSILELIPQRAPIVMVDEFLGIEDNRSKSRLVVREQNIFVNDGLFSECGLIEHIAQSAAARVGWIFRSKGEAVPLGYIGSVNDFVLNRLPRVGEEIYTEVEIVQEVFSITLIKATCKVDNEQIASCKMKIFLDSDEKKS